MSDPYFDGTIPLPGFSNGGEWNGRDTLVYGSPSMETGERSLIYEDHEGNTPFIGIPDGGNFFASHDPEAISEYKHDSRTRFWQGAAQIATLIVGGSALAGNLSAAPAAGGASAAPAATGAEALTGVTVPAGVAPISPMAAGSGALAPSLGMTAPTAAGVAAGTGAAAAVSGAVMVAPTVAPTIFSRIGSFLSNNRDIIGSVLTGIGEQIVSTNAQENLLREQRELISANYRGADPGKAYKPAAQNTQTQKPHERFAPLKPSGGGYQLRFDPDKGKVVRELMPAGG